MSANCLGLVASGGGGQGATGPPGPAGVGVASVSTTNNSDGTTSLTLNMTNETTEGPFSLYSVPSPLNVNYLNVLAPSYGYGLKVSNQDGSQTLSVDTDGQGQVLATRVQVQPSSDGTGIFQVNNSSGNPLLAVDTGGNVTSAVILSIQPILDTVALSVNNAAGTSTWFSVETNTGGGNVKTLNNTLDDGLGNAIFNGTTLTSALQPSMPTNSSPDMNYYTNLVTGRISGSTPADSSTTVIFEFNPTSSIANSAFIINMNLVCYSYVSPDLTWAYGSNNTVGIYYDNSNTLNFMMSDSPPTFNVTGAALTSINWQIGTDGNLQLVVGDNSAQIIYYNGYFTYFGTAVPAAKGK